MKHALFMTLVALALSAAPRDVLGDGSLLDLGPDQIVQAGGFDITVSGYSVPSLADCTTPNSSQYQTPRTISSSQIRTRAP